MKPIPALSVSVQPITGRQVLDTIAGWIAPVATMIAAMMTAANLGARITGWGFVLFVLASVCWSIVGISSGQTNLLVSNGFLTLINVIGVWRWLGRQRGYEDGGKSAIMASRRAPTANLFTATGITGMIVEDNAGQSLGKAVEALIECATGEISYFVVASGVLDESLRVVPRDKVVCQDRRLRVTMTQQEFAALAVLADGDWPASADPDRVRTPAGAG